MCTIVILRRKTGPWPLILAANRDEMSGRPWRPPGRHWPDRPGVVGGYDELAGGTWLAVNAEGVAAAVLNRKGTLGPAEGKRSRGELPLEAVDHADAAAAAAALSHLDATAWRPFNMIVADNRDCFWLRSLGFGRVECRPVNFGLSMLTASDLDDEEDARIGRFLPLFRAAPAPDPEAGDWAAWQALLAAPAGGTGPAEAGMTIARPDGFGTVCSTLLALPAADRPRRRPVHLFAAGRPGEAPYRPVPA